MSSDAKYEESNLSKLSFDPECQYFSLKVPKGFDVRQLKVSSQLYTVNTPIRELFYLIFSIKSLFVKIDYELIRTTLRSLWKCLLVKISSRECLLYKNQNLVQRHEK